MGADDWGEDGSDSTGSVIRFGGRLVTGFADAVFGLGRGMATGGTLLGGVEGEWDCKRVTGPEEAGMSRDDGSMREVSVASGVGVGPSTVMRSLEISDLCLLEIEERMSVAKVTLVEVTTVPFDWT